MNKDLKEACEANEVHRLLNGELSKYREVIDFFSDSPMEDKLGSTYTISFDVHPKKKEELYFLFPNHRKAKKTVLRCDCGDVIGKNKEINKRISESVTKNEDRMSVKFAIVYGSCVTVCNNITDTVYVIWCTVKRKNASNYVQTIYENWPLIFNYNGIGNPKSIFVVKTKYENEADKLPLPIGPKVMTFWNQKSVPMFVCESYKIQKDELRIKTMSHSEAQARMRYKGLDENEDSEDLILVNEKDDIPLPEKEEI